MMCHYLKLCNIISVLNETFQNLLPYSSVEALVNWSQNSLTSLCSFSTKDCPPTLSMSVKTYLSSGWSFNWIWLSWNKNRVRNRKCKFSFFLAEWWSAGWGMDIKFFYWQWCLHFECGNISQIMIVYRTIWELIGYNIKWFKSCFSGNFLEIIMKKYRKLQQRILHQIILVWCELHPI